MRVNLKSWRSRIVPGNISRSLEMSFMLHVSVGNTLISVTTANQGLVTAKSNALAHPCLIRAYNIIILHTTNIKFLSQQFISIFIQITSQTLEFSTSVARIVISQCRIHMPWILRCIACSETQYKKTSLFIFIYR